MGSTEADRWSILAVNHQSLPLLLRPANSVVIYPRMYIKCFGKSIHLSSGNLPSYLTESQPKKGGGEQRFFLVRVSLTTCKRKIQDSIKYNNVTNIHIYKPGRKDVCIHVFPKKHWTIRYFPLPQHFQFLPALRTRVLIENRRGENIQWPIVARSVGALGGNEFPSG